VGKSACLEYLTGAQGHSKSGQLPGKKAAPDLVIICASNAGCLKGTVNFQLERVDISGKRYYIMDTPGFDTNTEQAVFREIVRGIDAVRHHARVVGVMLVTRINDNRAEAIDNTLVTFVNKLCGLEYAAQITAVTTFWSVSEPEEKLQFETTLGECLQRWRAVLGQELKQYQHGRRYNSFGEDVGECLKWRGDADDIKTYAKAMINAHYGRISPRDPRIVQELPENLPLWQTAAGAFLGIVRPPSSSSSSSSASAASSDQPEATAPPPSTSEPEAQDIPRPSASSHEANSNESRSQTPPEPQGPSLIEEGLKWGWNNLLMPMAQRALVNRVNNIMGATTGGAGGGGGGGGGGGFPSHLGKCLVLLTPYSPGFKHRLSKIAFLDADTSVDPLSSRDHFLARGLPGDLGFRTQWAQAHDITLEPGSRAFGDALRKAIMREQPR
jgi:hypothetical protein